MRELTEVVRLFRPVKTTKGCLIAVAVVPVKRFPDGLSRAMQMTERDAVFSPPLV